MKGGIFHIAGVLCKDGEIKRKFLLKSKLSPEYKKVRKFDARCMEYLKENGCFNPKEYKAYPEQHETASKFISIISSEIEDDEKVVVCGYDSVFVMVNLKAWLEYANIRIEDYFNLNSISVMYVLNFLLFDSRPANERVSLDSSYSLLVDAKLIEGKKFSDKLCVNKVCQTKQIFDKVLTPFKETFLEKWASI